MLLTRVPDTNVTGNKEINRKFIFAIETLLLRVDVLTHIKTF